MVRSTLACAAWMTLVGLSAAGSLVGCGGGKGYAAPASSAGDASTSFDAGSDDATAGQDAGALGDGGVSCVDGGAGPKGTLLVKSATASLVGLTGDDQVVYVDTSTSTLFAVPAAGGSPTSIGRTDGAVRLASRAAFDWTGLNQDGTIGSSLQVWTSARGVQSLSSASLVGAADSSGDGSKVLYFDNASPSAADLYVAGSDGSNKTRLAPGIFWVQSCMPHASFLGSDAVLGYCTSAPSGSAPPVGTLVVFINAAGTGVTLSTSASLPSVRAAGTKVLYQDPAGLTVADATTGATTLIDPNGRSALFTHDGQNVVYAAADGSIKRSPIASASPSTLVPAGGFVNVLALSPDDRWLLASKTTDPNTGDTDLYVASATIAGAAATVLGSPTGTLYGAPFTADSTHLFYVDAAMGRAGDLYVARTSGGQGTRVASGVWLGLATTGAKIVYQDHFAPGVGTNAQGIADIESVDVSAGSPAPTLLVHQADPGLYFTSAGSRLVYSVTFCGAPGSQGVWVMPTP